jgi:gamma-glutamyltranspeptidase/glutathione hydrolase
MIASSLGVAASESVLASQVGARVLENGGNAVDAAIAINAMMGLVAPMNDGIGGDLFALVYEAKSQRLFGLNASGWSPAALSADYLASRNISGMPQRGIHTVTVPGVVDGWDQLRRRFGSKSFADLLAPAIAYANHGYAVSDVVHAYWRDSADILGEDAATASTFLPGGRVPRIGELVRNPELAWTYGQIAARGRDGFYRGEVASRILATFATHGGCMQAADLADFAAAWVEPISTRYRGWTVFELPPNGQGIAALEMLNIMERFALADMGHNSASALHIMIEAKKLAYADMLRYVGDPALGHIPVAGLNSKEFATQRATLIDPAAAHCHVSAGMPPGADRGTTYLAVADRHGNMVSLIQSNFASVGFGSGLAVAGAGFILQNRGALFTLEATHPNALAGRKRPLHTIIPAFMESGDMRIAFGIMGGWNQAQAHAQFVSNIVDFGMDIQSALDVPRFSKDTFDGCDVNLEARIPPPTRSQLAALGHELIMRGDFSSTLMGAGQAVARNLAQRMNYGASDPRKDGAAVSELLTFG